MTRRTRLQVILALALWVPFGLFVLLLSEMERVFYPAPVHLYMVLVERKAGEVLKQADVMTMEFPGSRGTSDMVVGDELDDYVGRRFVRDITDNDTYLTEDMFEERGR